MLDFFITAECFFSLLHKIHIPVFFLSLSLLPWQISYSNNQVCACECVSFFFVVLCYFTCSFIVYKSNSVCMTVSVPNTPYCHWIEWKTRSLTNIVHTLYYTIRINPNTHTYIQTIFRTINRERKKRKTKKRKHDQTIIWREKKTRSKRTKQKKIIIKR